MCWLGWRGEVVVLPSWKSVSFPWQLGNGAGGPGLETLLYDSGFRWAAVSWFLRNPVFVAGYSQPHPHPTPPHPTASKPSRAGFNFSVELGIANSPRRFRGRIETFFKLRNLAFSPFVAGFSHLKRALRHFKPVNGRALCAARWHLES